MHYTEDNLNQVIVPQEGDTFDVHVFAQLVKRKVSTLRQWKWEGRFIPSILDPINGAYTYTFEDLVKIKPQYK